MTDRLKGVVAMIVLAFVFAIMGIFARELDVGFSLLQQLYLRIGLAFLLAALMFAPFIDWRVYTRIAWWEWGLLAFRGISMYFAALLWTYAILNASYSNVAFVSAIPLLPFFGYYFFGDKLNIRIISFIGLGILGFLLIGVKDWSDILSVGRGELAALASVLFFDIVYVGRKWQSGLLSNGATATAMFLFGSVFLLGASLGIGEALPPLSAFTPWLAFMLVIAALLNVFHVTLTNYGFSKLTVTLAGTILMLESIFALGISIFLYSEIPTLVEFIGSVLILFSVYKINQLS